MMRAKRIFLALLATRAKLQFRRGAQVGQNVEIGWCAGCENRNPSANIVIGDHCSIWGRLICDEGARITIGSYTTVRYRSSIGAAISVRIGSYCILSNNITIWDNNNHPTDPEERLKLCGSGFYSEHWSWKYSDKKPVVIEDNVWIGQNALVLKGVTIGRGSIVAANAVVSKDVPPYSVVAGNPAVVVKTLRDPSNRAVTPPPRPEYATFPATPQ